MIARELISKDILPVRTSDTGDIALNIMSDNLVKHLPIVNDSELLGILSEDDVLAHDSAEPIGSYNLSLNRPYAQTDMHLFDVMAMMSEFNLSVVPVVNEANTYLGAICLQDLLNYFSRSFSFKEPGSIIVLEMHKSEYSLAELAQIIESERAAILSTFITAQADSMKVNVTLKVNKQEIGSILSAFNRYEITVKASYSESEYVDTLQERYDSLMNYLSV